MATAPILKKSTLNSTTSHLIGTTSTSSGTRKPKKIGIGWTNFAAVAMETKKGGI
jgi:hypothetical protein